MTDTEEQNKTPSPPPPPVDNEHVAPGAEKFSEPTGDGVALTNAPHPTSGESVEEGADVNPDSLETVEVEVPPTLEERVVALEKAVAGLASHDQTNHPHFKDWLQGIERRFQAAKKAALESDHVEADQKIA